MNYTDVMTLGDVHPAYFFAVAWGFFILMARLVHLAYWAMRLAEFPSSGGFLQSFKRLFYPPTKHDKNAEHYKTLLQAHGEGFFFNYLAVFSMVAVFMLGLKIG